jgi:hypothetical protein
MMKLSYFKKFDEKLSHNLNLNAKIVRSLKKFPDKICDICHVIFYGPPGSGKYTLSLKLIKRFTTNMNYEKKITTESFVIKLSDIHYEVDMGLLGCSSKVLWHEIFTQIVDSISVKKEKAAFILCKNFHEISQDLLVVFYAYLHDLNNTILHGVCIKYILITTQISFIPSNIVDACNVINVPHPSKSTVARCLKTSQHVNEDNLLASSLPLISNTFMCDKLIEYLITTKQIKISKIREHIYELLTANVNITDAIWYIFTKLEFENISNMFKSLYQFFRYFNNNYRPIFHIELILIKFKRGLKV